MTHASPITPTIPLDTDGVFHGFLKLPYSRDDSAWGAVMIPITVIKNGTGPTALLTGGNHGDEYEGPISLFKLASNLAATEISGRIIILPAMNYPAFKNASRTSPIDKGNLNRSFPGRPNGTVTEKIADYVLRYLVAEADFVLDMHSGGKTLDFVPFAAVHVLPDKKQEAACVAAMHAFGAPYSMMMLELDSVGMFDTVVEESGKTFVTTELGGGGATSAERVAITDRGVRNFLIHAGIVPGEIEQPEQAIMLDMPDDTCFVASENTGLFEPCVDLGETVKAGDIIARIYDTERTGIPATVYTAPRDGILSCRHYPGLIKTGDCLAVIADVVAA
ncbi:N(2)-acetyl-L-2,4-diaminobutanoate deacetylase DoeB [uncultured Thalassospira sp.]|jgi:N-alpha-acetyl-L-2,4-diaminobutyrate deacetylase|uniref:N(2)-acetyl-L-2,4-diaminobutanoate deacetylase DoeB n=1 Tax=uncultured Thalassospira sp. TaxID=404382 RepID=UPI0030D8BF3C|tara:strand:+ start:18697 stop:19698 length:1002 start_codon:yes stop_codon:yes gene_type:complete